MGVVVFGNEFMSHGSGLLPGHAGVLGWAVVKEMLVHMHYCLALLGGLIVWCYTEKATKAWHCLVWCSAV